MRRAVTLLTIVALSSSSYALPPPNSPYRAGANHHLGDDSFVAAFGRAPDDRDGEKLRMHTHLVFVRGWLAERAATRPDLAARRAELLGYLDDYIARGITPENRHVPWRSPVFIDDAGAICAVGYLIERSVGRAFAETIAARHRYDFLEDIAADMPEVAAWIASSGFTLDELASIQPAYQEPRVRTWRTWDVAKHPPKDGAYSKRGVVGTWKSKKMEDAWRITDEGGALVGRGDFKRGAGVWTSLYPTGKKLAEGPYVDNRAHGAWKLYHPSGNLAGEGAFKAGTRTGAWRFYYDTPGKTPLATGAFDARGAVTGAWQHFDATGVLVATTRTETPWTDWNYDNNGGEGFVLDVVPGPDGIRHIVHEGTVEALKQEIEAYAQRLEVFALAKERLYVHSANEKEILYDADGYKLVHGDGTWTAADCTWGAKRKKLAHDLDVAELHGLLYKDIHARFVKAVPETRYQADLHPTCGAAKPVAADRVATLDKLLAARDTIRSATPQAIREYVLGDSVVDADTNPDELARVSDLPRLLAAGMQMYIEWPHIDGRFIDAFRTMPGRVVWNWFDGDPEEHDAERD